MSCLFLDFLLSLEFTIKVFQFISRFNALLLILFTKVVILIDVFSTLNPIFVSLKFECFVEFDCNFDSMIENLS